jgi:YbbR domain-containing protein
MSSGKETKLFAKHILRKVFLEDWALKLTALGITLALWLGVTGLSTPATRRITVPLYLYVASNAQVVNQPPQEVEVELSGDKRKVEQLNRSDLVASVDLSDTASGERVVSLSPQNVYMELPQGVKLTDIAPSRIAVTIEKVEEREVEVRVETTGTPAAGYEVYSTTALPPRIRVRGPESIVRMVEYVRTEKISIAGKTDDVTVRQVPVAASDPKAAVLNTFVDVVYRIGERRVDRPVTVPMPGVAGKTVSFILYGPRSVVNRIAAADIRVEMSLNSDGEETPSVTLPEDVRNSVEVRRVRVN